MNILIIGNGFDLANGLPTRYPVFLDLCQLVSSSYVYYRYDKWQFSGPTQAEIELCNKFLGELGNELFSEFVKLTKKNLFIRDFIERRSFIGDKWLNFEEEIERFVGMIVAEMNNASNERYRRSHIRVLNDFVVENSFNPSTYKDLFVIIRNEHNGLKRLLEIYMDGYVNTLDITPIQGFKKGYYNHVLSFNYTRTFWNNYESEVGCCYIHGKADLDSKSHCNMVLGFDDRYRSPAITEVELLPYEKFFQRLELGTPNEYMDWLNQMGKEESNTVDIYGHSLALADADVLRAFMECPNTKTRVFFHGDDDRFEKLRNITMILGSEKTITMVGGINPSISFIPDVNYSAC